MILMCPHLHILQRPSPMPLSFTVFEASDFTSPSASGDRVLGVQISCGSGVTCGAWLGCQIEAFHPKSFIKSVNHELEAHTHNITGIMNWKRTHTHTITDITALILLPKVFNCLAFTSNKAHGLSQESKPLHARLTQPYRLHCFCCSLLS